MMRAFILLLLALSPLLTFAQTSVTTSAPVKNFKLPVLNEQGVRTSLLRGTEAHYIDASRIDLIGMQYTTFNETNNNQVDTTLIAPAATVFVVKNKIRVHGEQSMRFIREGLDVTGEQWTYDHDLRKVIIGKKVRVVFRTELKDILK